MLLSMKGKLFLLFIDKIIIGAIIAGAFFAYDRWKTVEVRDYNGNPPISNGVPS